MIKEDILEQIKDLFKQADEIFTKSPELANKYVKVARQIAMKKRLKIPSSLQRKYCKFCYTYLKPNINARIRTREGKLIIYCQTCKKYTRIPYKAKRL